MVDLLVWLKAVPLAAKLGDGLAGMWGKMLVAPMVVVKVVQMAARTEHCLVEQKVGMKVY